MIAVIDWNVYDEIIQGCITTICDFAGEKVICLHDLSFFSLFWWVCNFLHNSLNFPWMWVCMVHGFNDFHFLFLLLMNVMFENKHDFFPIWDHHIFWLRFYGWWVPVLMITPLPWKLATSGQEIILSNVYFLQKNPKLSRLVLNVPVSWSSFMSIRKRSW